MQHVNDDSPTAVENEQKQENDDKSEKNETACPDAQPAANEVAEDTAPATAASV